MEYVFFFLKSQYNLYREKFISNIYKLTNYFNCTYDFRHGMIKTLVTVYQVDGVTNGLYRGMSINFIRAVPMVAVSFSTYELMKQTLSLDTGVDS